jgi:hypothetical protein
VWLSSGLPKASKFQGRISHFYPMVRPLFGIVSPEFMLEFMFPDTLGFGFYSVLSPETHVPGSLIWRQRTATIKYCNELQINLVFSVRKLSSSRRESRDLGVGL